MLQAVTRKVLESAGDKHGPQAYCAQGSVLSAAGRERNRGCVG